MFGVEVAGHQERQTHTETSGQVHSDQWYAVVLLNTGSWFDLSAEHEVGQTGNEMPFTVTISMTSGVAEELYGLVVGVSGLKMRQEFSSA